MKALVNLWLIELKSIVNISINCSWRNNTVEKCFHSECFSPLFIILYAWSEVLLSLIFLYWPFKRLKNIKMYTQLDFLSRCLLNSGASLGRRLKHKTKSFEKQNGLFFTFLNCGGDKAQSSGSALPWSCEAPPWSLLKCLEGYTSDLGSGEPSWLMSLLLRQGDKSCQLEEDAIMFLYTMRGMWPGSRKMTENIPTIDPLSPK